MNRFSDDMMVGAFEKNGLIYHVLIANDSEDDPENLIPAGKFKGIFLHPLEKNIYLFYIGLTEDGHWVPDNKKIIDPWVADCIGALIENNLA